VSILSASIRSLAGVALGAALLFPAVASAALKVDGKPKVTFYAVGSPGFLDIEGVAGTMTAADDGTKLTFTVPMSSVHTGIDLRDEHMNSKYVLVDKFPNAILTLNKADVKWPSATVGESNDGTAKGTFNIHGQDQPVDVTYTVAKSKTGYRVRAKFNFDTTKSGIDIPSYLGVTVDPKMRAEVTTDLIDG
jgi:polyisoprenoid-binding protein YceI